MQDQKFKQRCKKHPDRKIEFIKIYNIEQCMQQKPFFICSECINSNLTFNVMDYQSIYEIIKYNEDKILRKWPPNNSQSILDSLIDCSQQQTNKVDAKTKVISYFKSFKQEINEQIDLIQSQILSMIENNYEENNIEIIKKYQEISKIVELKQHLLNQNTTLEEKEYECKKLINHQIDQKNNNSQLLSSLLNLNNNNICKYMLNTQSADEIKNNIFKSIEQLKLFKTPNNIDDSNQNQNNIDVKLLATQFNDGLNSQKICNNNKTVRIIRQFADQNTISDITLNNDLKYVFRIRIDNLEDNQTILLGLMKDINVHLYRGYQEKLSCQLTKKMDQLQKGDFNWGIHKQIQGDTLFQLTKEQVIEIRICLKDKILQAFDYPEYKYQITLDDTSNLSRINEYSYRFYIGMFYNHTQITLIDAFTVNSFL